MVCVEKPFRNRAYVEFKMCRQIQRMSFSVLTIGAVVHCCKLSEIISFYQKAKIIFVVDYLPNGVAKDDESTWRLFIPPGGLTITNYRIESIERVLKSTNTLQ